SPRGAKAGNKSFKIPAFLLSLEVLDDEKGHHSGRRRRQPAVPANEDRVQTAVAGLRQADDLLSPRHAYARRSAGNLNHLDAKRLPHAPRLPWGRLAVRDPNRLRGAGKAEW